ncbi:MULTISPECIES: cysteine--tRNA ligase [Bosea]|uniref:cysteine--tRNA ligase n=1 Tax=Bosea TaxID=85413 RepID=UPI00214FACC6|nr:MULTISPECIES: cysteine--tRNA ligase [Bosea]MCR4522603.1 cysteine--tRNA ligase [Bosea sp. 47.2.35]MDR6827109.1 cysteinyl-tRNA synthetase [Bosea robiniae]MDR6893819.1 cysteinyl-tRNA synthetase [Bosea sp. BE109]MDR7136481.1 cysteinyl-tRNA synthetase [Bosea sp. BE168]MDR7173180.1 cysteinyl-tRNA synthetase [Bosea sp. BE271]
MSPTLRLYNTLTRTKQDFVPIDPSNVRMYVCGPTVYDYAHIGNARPVIVFDVLYRLLRHIYGAEHVTYARNLTDVDDKINARAARDYPGLPLNAAIAKVTETTTAQFHADIDALGTLRPSTEPRATEHIEEMRAIIERLIARGVAYVAEEHVLFHVPAVAHLKKVPKYGTLARRSLDEMLAGARVDVAPYKRDAMDFVLWKPSRDGIDPGWPSPAGIATPGRPGWHIECSAMSMAKLLTPFGGGLACDDPEKNAFDIHGGGIDLVFPHHENEIAQSCCAFGDGEGQPLMANIWMHNGFLQVEGEKMSKSLGNFVTINELLQTDVFGGRTWPGEVLRLAMLKTHYRQPIDWTVKALEEAEKTLQDWAEAAQGSKASQPSAELLDALADDLNTARVLAELHALRKAGDLSALLAGLDLLGIALPEVAGPAVVAPEVERLVAARLDARRAKNFAESDRLRDELAAMGIALKDGKDPATGEPTTSWEVKR